jgi:hypothetical protein
MQRNVAGSVRQFLHALCAATRKQSASFKGTNDEDADGFCRAGITAAHAVMSQCHSDVFAVISGGIGREKVMVGVG